MTSERWIRVPKEQAEEIRKMIQNNRVQLADQEMVSKYEDQMHVVLGVLGHTEALVTDQSDVGDFIVEEDPVAELNKLTELSDIFGIKVGFRTPLWELARAITITEDTDGEQQD